MNRNSFSICKLFMSLITLAVMSIGFTDEAKSQQISFGPTQFVPVKKGGEVLLADTNWLPVWAIGWLFWDISNDSTFVIPRDKLCPPSSASISIEMLGARFEGEKAELFSYTTLPQLPENINPGDEFYVELKCNSPELISESTAIFFRMFFTDLYAYDVSFAEYAFIVTVGILEENEEGSIFYAGNNIYYIKDIFNFNLIDLVGKKIGTFSNIEILDLNYLNLKTGIYFLTYIKNNKLITKKILYY